MPVRRYVFARGIQVKIKLYGNWSMKVRINVNVAVHLTQRASQYKYCLKENRIYE